MTTSASTARRRSPRPRTFIPLAIAAWLVLEIWLLGVVSREIGGLGVLALLAAGLVLGVVVIKRAGRRAFRNLQSAFRQDRPGGPPGEAANPPGKGSGNGLTMLAGLLLIMPGLLSDAAGLLLLLPPVRSAVGRRFERMLEKKVAASPAGSFGDAFQQARIHYPDGKVVQGEVIREDPPTPDPNRPPLTP
ncbi:FxsA family membrane protein [Streptomyces sp. NPDC089799]|uniref:FxsA family membrane protein n=1 Tax=Streptomyces sp. NPDC089799 TaxID=3155066 RepID=UPI00343E895D